MKKLSCFAFLMFCFSFTLKAQNTDFSFQKDPFFQMQWVLKNPDGPFLEHTKIIVDNKTKYYYLPKSFWKDPESNVSLKEMLQQKFVQLYTAHARWAQEVSGIDQVFFLAVAARESAWGTSERYALSGGELFSVKLKEFQRSVGFSKGVYYSDDGTKELFVKLSFGWENSTWTSFKLFMLSITQDHYIQRLQGKGVGMIRKVIKWKQGNFTRDQVTALYSAESYMNCLCGYESFNWASDCEDYNKNFANMRVLLLKN